MASKVSIPKGTRDYLPAQVQKRNYLFDTIKSRFSQFGYDTIETPSFEYNATLLGKYGDEGDRLVFRILNSGEKVKKADIQALEKEDLSAFVQSVSEKALRYDLTVPFARFVVQHQNELTFPFKRFQIQPVWRADRPQHGRYQEFFQCDADVVGSDSLLYEVEQIKLFDQILSDLNIPSFTIFMNNRKILAGLADSLGCSDRFIEMVVSIDKLDKVGTDGVKKDLQEKGFSTKQIQSIEALLSLEGSNQERLLNIKSILSSSEQGRKGIEELEFIVQKIEHTYQFRNGKLKIDFSLARGLNYYTGAIFEVKVDNFKMGSICGGGRYDDLTALFGLKGISGVGISFGADRIYDVLEGLSLFPDFQMGVVKVLIVQFEDSNLDSLLSIQDDLRSANVLCEIYPSSVKIQKQMKYANDQGFTHALFQGIGELENNSVALKHLETGLQQDIQTKNIINVLKA